MEILALNGELAELKQLVDFILEVNFPHLLRETASPEEAVLALFSEIVDHTARLIAQWDAVGFVHGVLNTDNMSLLSLTIDYGPFGFVDEYDSHFVPNRSDDEGRYDLEAQAHIGLWNLDRLARVLKPLLLAEEQRKSLDLVLAGYTSRYQQHRVQLFRSKLGLATARTEDSQLIELLLGIMELTEADFTQTFRYKNPF